VICTGGLVDVRHGAGAGWSLARAPEEIMLCDVYNAVGQAPLFGMHRSEPNLACPVGRGIRPALGHIYAEIEEIMLRELERTSNADVLRLTLQEALVGRNRAGMSPRHVPFDARSWN
jgi:DNA-binding IscR family transcriptional regulator